MVKSAVDAAGSSAGGSASSSSRSVVGAALALALLDGSTKAEQPDAIERGTAVAEEADRRDLGWHDSAVSMRMTLRNRQGDESVRELRRRALEVEEPGLGDRSVIVFE